MKRTLSYFYTVILIILTSILVSGQNVRYVDKRVSSSGNGQSWSTAWKNFSNIVWSELEGGGTLYISGGSDSLVYYEQLTVGASGGGKNSYLKIFPGKYSPNPSGHSGRVVIDGEATRDYNIFIQNQDWVWVKGFKLTRSYGSAIYLEDFGKGHIVDSLFIYDFGKQTSTMGMGILIIGRLDSCIIRNNYVIDVIDDEGQNDCIHINMDYGNTSHYPSNIIVHNNFFRSTSQDPTAHNDAIQSVCSDGLIFYNNISINDSVNSQEGGGMPFIISGVDRGHHNPVILFNNFAYMGGIWYPGGNYSRTLYTRHDDGGNSGNQPPRVLMFNNTFVSNGPTNYVMEQQYLVHFFSNNILASYCPSNRRGDWFDNLDGSSYYGEYLHVDSTRNNLNWRQDSTQTGLFQGTFAKVGGTFSPDTWADWTSNGGTGLNRDPLFVNNFGKEPNQGALRPDLKPNSPAIDAGEDLTYVYYYIKNELGYDLPEILYDIYGNPRGEQWDIGAFEYVASSSADTIPAFSFSSVNNADLNTEYTASSTFTGADSTFHVWTTTGAEFRINNGSYSTSMKTAENNDVVYVKNQTGNSYSTLYRETIVGGGVSRNFDVTTKAAPPPPSGSVGVVRGSNGRIIYQSNGRTIIK